MDFKNDYKTYDFKFKKDENLENGCKLGIINLERMDTRLPDDDNPSSKIQLKKYLSQIKYMRNSKEPESNSYKFESNTTFKSFESQDTRPIKKEDRLKKLEKSLSGIQSSAELKRTSILEEIYQKINKLENKILDSEEFSVKKIETINKKIESLETSIDNIYKKHENVLNEKAEAIDNICEKFHDSLSKEHENWLTGEKNILENVNKQINAMKDEISEMKTIKTDIISNFKLYTDVELPNFKEKIEKTSTAIYTMEERVIKNTAEDLLTLANFIKEEDEKINDWKDKMKEAINKELKHLQMEIKKECEEREDTQKKLIVLMEETVKRLESPL
ncbi:conserved hypothetical protein [Theileria orientalis strain Shintoku]|uniref:Uncharacterized protein n=1 Tax=Theileria orientalis strain Shintoku TaxID=869250 RepID=J4CDT4_THEOR|nr:conserved hypothetical protein [Theileria orientalis strain Shintoku]PVC53610.1 hypothetical protein MACL_00003613 [Theileria orientalis]BAM41697.1 conserved hypothetical protein [Theileria orientalis strain Shintoku]|eukprot:XP_009691998.1 conserved hypothetical protein [Theileria orientalis strain Shintoku]